MHLNFEPIVTTCLYLGHDRSFVCVIQLMTVDVLPTGPSPLSSVSRLSDAGSVTSVYTTDSFSSRSLCSSPVKQIYIRNIVRIRVYLKGDNCLRLLTPSRRTFLTSLLNSIKLVVCSELYSTRRLLCIKTLLKHMQFVAQ